MDFGFQNLRLAIADDQLAHTRQIDAQGPLGQKVVTGIEGIEAQPQGLAIGSGLGLGAGLDAHAVHARRLRDERPVPQRPGPSRDVDPGEVKTCLIAVPEKELGPRRVLADAGPDRCNLGHRHAGQRHHAIGDINRDLMVCIQVAGREVHAFNHRVEVLARRIVRIRHRQPDLADSEKVPQSVQVLDAIHAPHQAVGGLRLAGCQQNLHFRQEPLSQVRGWLRSLRGRHEPGVHKGTGSRPLLP